MQNNLGVGDFDLPARGYSQEQTEYIARLGDSGVFGKKFFNEARLQARWITTEARSVSLGQTILVPGSFNDGSAQRSGGRRSLDFELADNVDYALEKHGLRFGAQLEAGGYRSNDRTNAFGTFQFADLAAYEAGLPTQYTQRIGDPTVKYRQYQFGWYVQDDFRVRKNLTLSYGARHEVQNHVPGKFNVAPRFGFVWSPLKSGAVTIRGGTGIFYDWFAAQTYEQTLRVDGQRQRDLVIANPGFPNPLSGGMQTVLPPSRIQTDPDLQIPYIIQSSIGVETNPFKLFRLTTNYQYQRGVHLLHGRNLNAPVPGLGRPDPTVGNITNIESSAYQSSHRLMVGIGPAKFVQGLFWNINYLLMKNTNEADSPFSLPSNNFNLHADRGPSANDFRHLISGFVSKRLAKRIQHFDDLSSDLGVALQHHYGIRQQRRHGHQRSAAGRRTQQCAWCFALGDWIPFELGKRLWPGATTDRRAAGQDGAHRWRRWRGAAFNRDGRDQEVSSRILRAGLQSSESCESGRLFRCPNLALLRPGHFGTVSTPYGIRNAVQLLICVICGCLPRENPSATMTGFRYGH